MRCEETTNLMVDHVKIDHVKGEIKIDFSRCKKVAAETPTTVTLLHNSKHPEISPFTIFMDYWNRVC